MKRKLIIAFLLSLSLDVMAIEDFFIEQDTLSVPNGSFFELPTIPQRFIDEARGDIVVQLTNDDYVAVAARLNVDVAAIKAVVEIETGKQHKGFMAPRKPIIYFDEKYFVVIVSVGELMFQGIKLFRGMELIKSEPINDYKLRVRSIVLLLRNLLFGECFR